MKSYNSSNIYERILDEIIKADIEMTPKQIAFRTSINHSTVRVYVRKLLKEGKVYQPYYGCYKAVTNSTHGVGALPKIHNVILSIPCTSIQSYNKDVFVIGNIKFHVIYGSKNKKITCYISSQEPLNLREFRLSLQVFIEVLYRKIRYRPSLESIVVKSCEFNKDYSNIRMDGMKSLTLKSFDGMLERLYNKNGGLRHEVKVRPQNVQTIYALMKGGVTSYNLVQGQFMLIKMMKELINAFKFTNRLNYDNQQLFKEFLKRLPE